MITENFTIHTLETCRFALDGGAMFGVVPKNLWAKAYSSGDTQNRIPMAARVLLIRGNGRTILVDTGNGDKLTDKLKKIYDVDTTQFSLTTALHEHNLTKSDITDVILTHLHFDHAGGATEYNGNEIVPAFPNAKYYVQKEQLQWARNATEKDRASFMPENYEPLYNHGVLELTDGDGELFSGIRVQPLYGHSKGMQMILVEDGASRIAFPADLSPTHAHVPIPYVMGYDNYPLTSIEEKKTWMPRFAEDKWLVVFEHDAMMEAGYIEETPKGFAVHQHIAL